MNRLSFLALLAASTALVSAGQVHAQAQANPQSSSLPHNSQLVSGAATVSQTSATQTTITQTSQSAILNWQSFSIGKGDTVDVVQPGTTSVLLNRVTGQAPSTIAGQLNANGQVFLINPNGIVIGKTGVVQASGFVASTLDISDSDFLAGRLNFKATGPSAAVVHAGTIRIAPGGYAALLGGSVTDTGEIVAPLGKVAIGAGSAATLDLSGDGFLQVALTGTTDATGVALLSAADARDAVRQTVNMDGVTAAASATGQDGHVVLSGTVDTSDASGAGGNVKVLGTTLDLAGGVINAGHAQVETSGGTVDFTGIKVSAGNWLVDPTNLTIDAAAAATISSNLATTDVTLQTTASGASGPGVQSSGAGDIIVSSAISWGSSYALTLDAYGAIGIDAPITIMGAGKVNLTAGDIAASGMGLGAYNFGLTATGFTGSLNFTGAANSGQALSVNGAAYTLLYTASDLAGINNGTGYYALARSLDLSGTTYGNAFVPQFSGAFEGLGHTISNFNLVSTAQNATLGLFGTVGGRSISGISDLGLVGGSVKGVGSVGDLVGELNAGAIVRSYATGTVTGGTNTALDGGNMVGGLVGYFTNYGSIRQSFATGAVSGGTDTGVEAGNQVGGLVGYYDASTGAIVQSFATGNVDGGSAPNMVGGGNMAGGLVGLSSGQLIQDYATGNVTSEAVGELGGLVGDGSGSQVYATGMVTGPSGSYIGALAGSGGGFVNGYWNTQTSGLSVGVALGNASGSTGLTTAQLQGALPSGFDSSVWAGGSGLYPYLKWQYPTGAQAITGYADTASSTAAAGASVSLYANGTQLGSTVYSGANGYYYDLVPAGTVTARTPIGTVMTLAGATGVSGLAFNDTLTVSGNTVNNASVLAARIYGSVSLPTWSSTLAEMSTAFGASRFSSLETTAAFNHTDIYGLLSTFTIDVAQDVTGTFKVTGPVIDAAPITVEPGATVMFISNGALAIDAPITLKGNGAADLRYDYSLVQHGGAVDPSAFSFGAAGSLTYLTSAGATATSSQGGTLKINDTPYTLVYSMAQLDAIDGVNALTGATTTTFGTGTNGYYALAGNLNAQGTTYGQALIGNFNGTFEGTGHAISNLTINATASTSNTDIGLFGMASGTIRDLNLSNLSLTAKDPSAVDPLVGGLVAFANGGFYNDSISGDVNASAVQNSLVGGVAGRTGSPTALFKNVTSAATVETGASDDVGGLIGWLSAGTVLRSSATGNITGGTGALAGGLAGYVLGTVEQSYATGNVTVGAQGEAGGLAALNYGTIDQSYATGSVTSNGALDLGGLVGINGSSSFIGTGAISNSYATGTVTDGTTISSGQIWAQVGGLVGGNVGQVIDSFSTGMVLPGASTSKIYVGGLIGGDYTSATNSYWNIQTSGQPTTPDLADGTGATTAQLQGTLPTGFNSAVWGTGAGLYPYLKWQYPTGAQAITGYADTASSTAAAGASVSLYANGTQLGSTVYSGANGYYYDLVPAGTVTARTPIGTVMTLAGATGVSGLAFNDTLTVSGNTVNNASVLAARIYGSVSLPTWSSTLAEMSTAFGASRFSSLETTAAFNHTDIYGLLSTFTIDVAQDVTGTFKVTGPVIDAAPITVEPGATVMFISNGALAIDAPITLKGNGAADLRYDYSLVQHGGAVDPSAFSFGAAGSLTYLTSAGATATSSQGGTLKINDTPYTLVYSMAQLDAIDGVNALTGATTTTFGTGTNGYYALAGNLNAQGTTYGQALIGNFNGTFEGTGHAISNLTINATASTSNTDIGLFGMASGTIRDLNLSNLSLTAKDPSAVDPLVGGLVAFANGGFYNDSISGDVNASAVQNSLVGGVAGRTGSPTALFKNVTSAATVETGASDDVGGLIGWLSAGTVLRSSATGNITGGTGALAGGLAGYVLGTVEQSYATGNVTVGAQGEAGGLAALNYGTIDQSYATGSVTSNGALDLGGLVGINGSSSFIGTGAISNSYATGTVTDGTTISSGQIWAQVGGLVGGNVGQVIDSFSTGMVLPGASTSKIYVGGLIGGDYTSATNSYWNIQTSGQPTTPDLADGTGATTAQLQGTLPTGFNSAVWGTGAGLYPYLKWQYPTGAQAITGYADTASSTAAAGASVSLYANGTQLGSTVYSGANGYYYDLVPAGTVTARTPIGTVMTLAGATGVSGLAFNDTLTVSGNTVNNASVLAARIYGSVSLPTWSSTLAEMSTAFGASRFSSLETTAAFNHTDIYGLLSTFTIDVAQDVTGTFKVTGPVIDAAPITVEPGATVMFISNGALAIDAPITLKGNGAADLRYDYSLVQHGGAVDPSAFSFGAAGSLTYLTSAGATATSSQGGTLKINDTPYTLVYSMAQLDAIDGVNALTGATTTTFGTGTNGYYALAGNLNAQGTTYGQALIGNFNGTFEGTGHAISNLTINATASTSNTNIGLFGGLHGTVRDLNLANLSLTVTGPSTAFPSVGGLAGTFGGSLYNDSVGGDVNASAVQGAEVGGVIGWANSGTIKNVTASDTVEGATGGVSGGGAAGGLVGWLSSGSLTGSSAGGNVTGGVNADAGGLVGWLAGGTVSGSSATGNVTGGAGTLTGGLAGNVAGTIEQSYASGNVTGGSGAEVGGLSGGNSGTIDQSYATGLVLANNGSAVGGLVGMNIAIPALNVMGVISNSYATGNVTDATSATPTNADVGGLVGSNSSQITGSYATGLVLPAASTSLVMAGGLVGYNSGTVTSSYWNTQTSGQATSAAGVALTTAQLQGALPTGFNPALWATGSGHNPKLAAVAGQ